MKYHLVLSLFLSLPLWAAPQSLEVWFLSKAKLSQLKQSLDARPAAITLTARLECQEMGDFCFDPQYGLYKKDDANAEALIDQLEEKTVQLPAAQSLERELINCDPKNFFDIFCGKARAVKTASAKLDIWVDTSSSMREFDYTDKEGGCYRQSLLKRLDKLCPFNQKMNVMMFDTAIKEAGSMESVCINRGLNDYKRLMDWIERSDAKKLIVITDIYELHKEFADFVESKNGKIKGDKDPMPPEAMLNLVDDLAKNCQ